MTKITILVTFFLALSWISGCVSLKNHSSSNNLSIKNSTNMKQVTIYTTSTCPYCLRAKSLFEMKGIQYQEINVENSNKLREEMVQRAGGRKTVPQIFVGNRYIGGCDDLYQLDSQGELNDLLAS